MIYSRKALENMLLTLRMEKGKALRGLYSPNFGSQIHPPVQKLEQVGINTVNFFSYS